jgi:hypothetical protein
MVMLSRCRRCGQIVPVGTARCPACGLKNPAPSGLNRLLWLIGLTALLIVLLFLLFRGRP